MKAKITLTALFSFLLVYGQASQFNSTVFIDVVEHPNNSYLVVLNNGNAIESTGDLKLRNVRNGNNRIKVFKRTYRATRRNPNGFNDRIMFDGFIQVPGNSKVFTQLFQGNLITKQVIAKNNTRPNENNTRDFGMRNHNFQALKQTVLNENFDKNKLELLNTAIIHNSLNSRQVKELMDLMTFDTYKLSFAKKAYINTLDKQNYFLVNEGLTFNSNKKELLRFINQQAGDKNLRRRNRR